MERKLLHELERQWRLSSVSGNYIYCDEILEKLTCLNLGGREGVEFLVAFGGI
jgi:hypothetical protein